TGNTITVSLSDDADNHVIADAIRLDYINSKVNSQNFIDSEQFDNLLPNSKSNQILVGSPQLDNISEDSELIFSDVPLVNSNAEQFDNLLLEAEKSQISITSGEWADISNLSGAISSGESNLIDLINYPTLNNRPAIDLTG
ncbi:MAG TPA: hypothetical protein DCF68_03000, partial [Cyanothece sp. UBA12306]|nr:hypothetical protein [Cyanothece sp. UBA12306]